ncbi:MAG: DUF3179 domain-containing protein [Patescibacteria group bacterium]|nr:DUF3179 domain-containing protein [Patescibacteria group bacterium]
MKKKIKKLDRRFRVLLTILFVLICASAVVLVWATLDQEEDLGELQAVPHSVDFDQIIDGGPPKDGILSIDEPKFIKAEEADPVIEDDEIVLIVENFRGAKIFPLKILVWHQIVNDTKNDPPLLVTYDPFTNNISAYKSLYNDQKLLTFGVSGKLYESNTLMYDRETNSLWTQFNGEGIVGELIGAKLQRLNSYLAPWKYVKKKYTDALVLSRETGTDRDYDHSPYEVYLNSDKLYFDISRTDDRLKKKDIVYGIELNGTAKAYPDTSLEDEWLITDIIGETPVLILKNPQTGTVKAFKSYVYGWPVEFEMGKDGITDKRYQAKWDFDGKCVYGRIAGWQLTEIPVIRSYWFGWYIFNPETELYLANKLPKEEST